MIDCFQSSVSFIAQTLNKQEYSMCNLSVHPANIWKTVMRTSYRLGNDSIECISDPESDVLQSFDSSPILF